MKNSKKLLFVSNLLLITSFLNAQHFISATEMGNRNISKVQANLNWLGWDTSTMTLNAVKSYKILYNTTDVHGNPTIASGALYVPQTSCNTMPLISWQHGTVFQKSDVPSNKYNKGTGLLYSGNGYITTMPDYLGMGDNPGIHPYIHSESEATASINLIRAAREFLRDSLQIRDNNQLFLAGYSQGGHSTMAVHKYIKINDLQSEFNVIASAPMSGPYALSIEQFDLIFDKDSSYYMSLFLPYAMASYQLVYGNLYTNYNDCYDTPYDSLIASWLAPGGKWNALPVNYYEFMQDSVISNIQNKPNHPINVALRKNDLHNWLPLEPVRMLYCGMDSMVAPQNAITALNTMNALGAPDVKAIDLDPNGDHGTCVSPSLTYALDWFDSLKVECQMVISTPYQEKQPELSLFPNPVKDRATVFSEAITSTIPGKRNRQINY